MKILLNQKAENFRLSRSFKDYEPESNDGMRRGHSYTVDEVTEFRFEDEHKENGNYTYNLHVLRKRSDYHATYDLVQDEKSFSENFDYIHHALRSEGLEILSHSTYQVVSLERHSSTDDDNAEDIEICICDSVHLIEEDGSILNYQQVVDYVNESRELKIALAIGDSSVWDTGFKVSSNTIPEDAAKVIRRQKASLSELLSSGEVTDSDVEAVLLGRVSRVNKSRSFRYINVNGLEKYVLSLPQEQAGKVLRLCKQNRACLELRRQICPQTIDWRSVAPEDMRDSDLNLMILSKAYAYTEQQWKYIAHCMESPELEKKVVANAYILGHCNLFNIVSHLRTTTPTDLFRSVLGYLAEKEESFYLRNINDLFNLQYESLDEHDYHQCLSAARFLHLIDDSDRNSMAAFALKIGVTAGVSESELAAMLQGEISGRRIDRLSWSLRRAYRELNFAPGLAWIKAEEERQEAEKQRIAAELAASNERIVDFARVSGKVAICVKVANIYDGKTKISHPDGEAIGYLKSDEQRVLLVEGLHYGYLIDIERAKTKGDILHLDILEKDAGYVIGRKGSKLEETAKRLRSLGCPVRTIRVHKHETL